MSCFPIAQLDVVSMSVCVHRQHEVCGAQKVTTQTEAVDEFSELFQGGVLEGPNPVP